MRSQAGDPAAVAAAAGALTAAPTGRVVLTGDPGDPQPRPLSWPCSPPSEPAAARRGDAVPRTRVAMGRRPGPERSRRSPGVDGLRHDARARGPGAENPDQDWRAIIAARIVSEVDSFNALGKEGGVSASVVSRFGKGERDIQVATAQKLCAALDLLLVPRELVRRHDLD